jgi:hypothetical protein
MVERKDGSVLAVEFEALERYFIQVVSRDDGRGVPLRIRGERSWFAIMHDVHMEITPS